MENKYKEKDYNKILKCLLEGLNDYEIDKKLGDVGAEIRIAWINGLTEYLLGFINIVNEYSEIYVCGLLKQLSEKMNKIRLAAGENLQKFSM